MPGVRIPDTLLLAPCAFSGDLPAGRVAALIARGVLTGGMPAPEECPIEDDLPADFDSRMRHARAVVVGQGHLSRETLLSPQGSTGAVFEIATRARQAGVPAYAVTAHNKLDAFDARMLDLQVVIEARNPRGLSAAGRRLAELA